MDFEIITKIFAIGKYFALTPAGTTNVSPNTFPEALRRFRIFCVYRRHRNKFLQQKFVVPESANNAIGTASTTNSRSFRPQLLQYNRRWFVQTTQMDCLNKKLEKY
jgi:hypothetical protein